MNSCIVIPKSLTLFALSNCWVFTPVIFVALGRRWKLTGCSCWNSRGSPVDVQPWMISSFDWVLLEAGSPFILLPLAENIYGILNATINRLLKPWAIVVMVRSSEKPHHLSPLPRILRRPLEQESCDCWGRRGIQPTTSHVVNRVGSFLEVKRAEFQSTSLTSFCARLMKKWQVCRTRPPSCKPVLSWSDNVMPN